MATYTWDGASGEWGDNADWTPNGQPTITDTALVELGGTLTVGPTDYSAAAKVLNVNDGAVVVEGELLLDSLTVGAHGAVTVDGGTLVTGVTAKANSFHQNANVLVEDGGILETGPNLEGAVSGTVTLESGGEYFFDDSVSSSTTGAIVDFTNTGGEFVAAQAFKGKIENFNTSDSNSLSFDSQITSESYNLAQNVLTVHTTVATYTLDFTQNSRLMTGANFAIVNGGYAIDYTGPTAVCFASGTRIRTARGEVPVEALSVDDMAITAAGEARPIRWLGHRRINCRLHPRPAAVQPIRIAAGAFGPNRPTRDLTVSPGHAICVDVLGEALIPASALVNGATIQQLDVDEVAYWHVELYSHDILMAENLPAESYFDAGNRAFFFENEVVQLSLTPDAILRAQESFCRPFHEAGALVDAVRAQLTRRAYALGWTLHDDPLADLHLLVDGRRVEPIVEARRARFSLSADAREVWLASTTTRPLDVVGGADRRTLGVCVTGLSVEAGDAGRRDIPLDDPSLDAGFHEIEREGTRTWRWTESRARLPATLWAELAAHCTLAVDLGGDAPPRWVWEADRIAAAG